MPAGPRSFQGYRMLHEYFAMPERFLFVELGGLSPALRRCPGSEIDLFILFNRVNRVLEHRVDASSFALFCTPAANLFPKRADRIQIDNRKAEFQILPDRTRPLDYEPYAVTEVIGYGDGDKQQVFLPFYASLSHADASLARDRHGDSAAYYTLRRTHRTLSEQQRRLGPRSSYIGSELYLSLVDAREAPFAHDLRQLSVPLLCTNRDLPLLMPVGTGDTDFSPEVSSPIRSARCLVGPTRPRAALSYGTGEAAWRLVNHLSLNYMSLVNDPQRGGAAAVREMLSLYADLAEAHVRKQIDGVQSVVARPVTRARANQRTADLRPRAANHDHLRRIGVRGHGSFPARVRPGGVFRALCFHQLVYRDRGAHHGSRRNNEMADPDRSAAELVALLREIEAAPHTFDFFQALRRLECAAAAQPRLGESARPRTTRSA